MLIEHSDASASVKKVLNVGSGEDHPTDRPIFQNSSWQTVRLDIDPDVKPDLLGSITDLDRICDESSFDAIFSSHSLEHLFAHEVLPALRGFHRILKTDGFALVTCPDLETVMTQILKHGLDSEMYPSPAGPILGLDILFGHTVSIAHGKVYMAHKTGFTNSRLANVLFQAGFSTVVVDRLGWDLWAIGMREHADRDAIRQTLRNGGLKSSI